MKRPLKNNRPLGPLLSFSSTNSNSSEFTLDASEEEIKEFKHQVETQLHQEISYVDAKAIMALDVPMLQSYVTNVLDTASQHSDSDVSVESVIKSNPTQKYAVKVGAEQEIENAASLYN